MSCSLTDMGSSNCKITEGFVYRDRAANRKPFRKGPPEVIEPKLPSKEGLLITPDQVTKK